MPRFPRPRLPVLLGALLAALAPAAQATNYTFDGGSYSFFRLPTTFLSGDVLTIDSTRAAPLLDTGISNAGQIYVNSSTLALTGGTLDNSGMFVMNGATPLITINGGALVNRGGMFVMNGDGILDAGQSTVLNQSGLFGKFSGTGTMRVTGGGATFINNGGGILAYDGVLQFDNATSIFNAGTSFTGHGTTRINSWTTFNDSFSVDPNSHLILAGPTTMGASTTQSPTGVLAQGVVDFQGGSLQGTWTVASGSVFNALGSLSYGAPTLMGTLNNLGTLNLGTHVYGDGLTINNEAGATLNLASRGNWLAYPGGWSINNRGTVVNDGSGTSVINAGIAFTNYGTIALQSNATLQFAGINNRFMEGTSFTGGGTALITGDAVFSGASRTDSSTYVVLQGGRYTGMSPTPGLGAALSGNVNLDDGTLGGNWHLSGNWFVSSSPSGGKARLNGTIYSDARINVSGDLYGTGSAFTNAGTLSFNTDGEVLAAGNTWYWNNRGEILKGGGEGITTFHDGVVLDNLAGGIIRVDTGTLAIDAPGFVNDGTLVFGIGSKSSYGHITLDYHGNLGGSFAAAFEGGYRPVVGDGFDVMNVAPGMTGGFSNSTYTVDGVTFTVVYAGTNVMLQVSNVAAVPEPSSVVMLLAGLGLVGALARRRSAPARRVS